MFFDLEFPSAPWPSISGNSKDLRKMLVRDPKLRLIAHQVLCHPWVQIDGVTPLDFAVLSRMKQFSTMDKFKRMALSIIAESLLGLKEMLKMINADNSGQITFKELKAGLKRVGANLKESDILDLMQAATVNKDHWRVCPKRYLQLLTVVNGYKLDVLDTTIESMLDTESDITEGIEKVADDLRLLIKSEHSSIVKKIVSKHSSDLLAGLNGMHQQIEKEIDNVFTTCSHTYEPWREARTGPDFFGYFRAQVEELLSQEKRISHHKHGATHNSTTEIIGAQLPDLKNKKLKALFRQCMWDSIPEVACYSSSVTVASSESDVDDNDRVIQEAARNEIMIACPSRHKIIERLPFGLRLHLKRHVIDVISHGCAQMCLGEKRYKLLLATSPPEQLWISDSKYRVFIFWKKGKLLDKYLQSAGGRKRLQAAAGFVRDQLGHSICWAYSICDLVSISRVLYGWDNDFTPLSPAYLCQNVKPELYEKNNQGDGEHCCYGCGPMTGLFFVQKNGIPRESPNERVFNCRQKRDFVGEKYHIKDVFRYPTLEEALLRLKTHPILASLICFEGWGNSGIYRGPVDGAKYEGRHSVIMMDCVEIDGETVVLCKSSNGIDAGNDGYISVSVQIMVIEAGARRKAMLDDYWCYKKPTYLLCDFYSVDMEMGPNPKIYEGKRLVKANSRFKIIDSSTENSGHASLSRVYKGNENNAKKINLMGHSLHPFLERSYVDFLKEIFEGELQATQSIFSSKEKYEKILGMITDEDIQSELRGKWENSAKSSLSGKTTSLLRWEQLKKTLQSKKNKALSLRTCVEETVFTFTYPQIDLEVSKQMNHLLKAPFCVHPKTGRVCAPPIHQNNCNEFDPLAVPTLSQLIEEINSGGLSMDVDDDSDRNLLGKSIKFFRFSFLGPLIKSCEVYYSKKAKAKSDLEAEMAPIQKKADLGRIDKLFTEDKDKEPGAFMGSVMQEQKQKRLSSEEKMDGKEKDSELAAKDEDAASRE